MKCADPILCYNTGKTKIYRHYSLATGIHRTMAQTVFPCGGRSPTIDCIYCKKRRSKELAMRCVLHASLYEQNCFLTLTYDEKQEGYKNELNYKHIQNFKKKLRNLYRIPYSDVASRKCKHYYTRKLQIFNVHEFGKNHKKHWHLVVFNHDFQDKQFFTTSNSNRLYISDRLQSLWHYGHHTIGDVSEASALYQAQYLQKDVKYSNVESRKAKSNHNGIGREYFLQNYSQILRLGYVPFNGLKHPIPRYFEKVAHKHYSYYYALENFEDLPERKKLYTKFKPGQANQHMAELYKFYRSQKEIKIQEIALEWEQRMEQEAYSEKIPDFRQAGENRLHDFNKRLIKNTF